MQYGPRTYDDAAADGRRSLRIAVNHGSIPNAGSGPDSNGIQISCDQVISAYVLLQFQSKTGLITNELTSNNSTVPNRWRRWNIYFADHICRLSDEDAINLRYVTFQFHYPSAGLHYIETSSLSGENHRAEQKPIHIAPNSYHSPRAVISPTVCRVCQELGLRYGWDSLYRTALLTWLLLCVCYVSLTQRQLKAFSVRTVTTVRTVP
jgi:hypothetical protein